MEAAIVSAVTGALKPVIGKLGALLSDEYKRFKGVRKDIKSLIKELAKMNAFLQDMSREDDPRELDKLWMNEVRELSYNMEDTIDDFVNGADDEATKPDGFIEKIRYSLAKMKARCRTGKEIKELKKDIIEVGIRNARYNGRVPMSNSNERFGTSVATSSTHNSTIDNIRAVAIFEHASKLVGIDEPKAEVIGMLTQMDGGSSGQQYLKLVSIVGLGGMGKTTLASQVYEELKRQFDCWGFVSVSRNPDLMNILRTILAEVKCQGYRKTEAGNIQQLIDDIRGFLENKRYFIVVDDIWDVDTWNIIKCIFPISNHNSTVITTTRKSYVAEACHSSFSGNIYSIRPLSMVHSRELFRRRLLHSGESLPSELIGVSDNILEKCDGLPLAVITISGLLANKERTEDLWNKVKDSIGRGLERDSGVRTMMNILSLSYFDLPPQLRSCLLYMCIFPEDSIVERKELIRRWIGEGLIHKEGMYTAHEIGDTRFNELLNKGLIQPMKLNEDDSVKTCRVHDMILDFIISRSIEENFVTIVGIPIPTGVKQSNIVRRLSVQVGEQGNLIAGLEFSHARSLHVFRDVVQIPSLEKCKHLRVLHLKHYRQLENHHLESMARLFQLRYLNLKNTGISELPEQIGRLGCLEMLDLRQTDIKELPASIVNLRKLSHLFVGIHVKFPNEIEKMQELEMLKKIMVFNQSSEFPSSLGQLINLKNLALDLHFCTEDIYVDREKWEEETVSSLCQLGTQKLQFLSIWNGTNLFQRPWCPIPVTLKKLITWRSPILQVPEWMGSLRNLQHLRLIVGGVKQEDLCMLGALESLLILHLQNENENYKTETLRIGGDIGFHCLRIFNYDADRRSTASDLMFGAGSMPKLEKLVLSMMVAEGASLEFGMNNLPSHIISKVNVKRRTRPSALSQRLAAGFVEGLRRGRTAHPV